VFYRKFKALIL